jgi:hypothetical protein
MDFTFSPPYPWQSVNGSQNVWFLNDKLDYVISLWDSDCYNVCQWDLLWEIQVRNKDF